MIDTNFGSFDSPYFDMETALRACNAIYESSGKPALLIIRNYGNAETLQLIPKEIEDLTMDNMYEYHRIYLNPSEPFNIIFSADDVPRET